METGLVSVSFRKLSPEEIIALTVRACLDSIEWGGDIHVPHGNTALAGKVKQLTADAGLKVAAYGSYYRCLTDTKAEAYVSPTAVLDTAAALGAPMIRVWAGARHPEEYSEAERRQITEALADFGDRAAELGMEVVTEFHGWTLTETTDSAVQLMEEVAGHNVYSLWQPPVPLLPDEALVSLRRMLPWLRNLHVFTWDTNHERFPLEAGYDKWLSFFNEAKKAKAAPHRAMLEFVVNDDPKQLIADAEILRKILADAGEYEGR